MAIVQETVTFDGRQFRVTTSSIGMMIANEDGQLYAEAWDLPEIIHTYTETDLPIVDDDGVDPEAEYAEAGRIVLGLGE